MAVKSSRLNIPIKYSIKPVKDINFELTSEEVNQIVEAVNNNELFFSSEIQETKNIVMAISAGEGGVMYDTLAAAQVIDPKPANGIVFQVSKKTDPDNAGVYSFQSSEPGGTRPEHPLYVNNTEVVKKVDTLAEARALNGLLDGQAIYILGRDAKGDGLICDKPFYYFKDDLTAENGGTVFTATGGTLKAYVYDFVNLRWFGAKDDGVTDVQPEFQKAIDYIDSVGGGCLGVDKGNSAGNYFIDSKVVLCSNIRVLGLMGEKATISGSASLLSNYNDGDGSSDITQNYKNIEIAYLTLKSTINVFFEHRHLIKLGFVTNVKIHDNDFIGWQGDAVYISGSAGIVGTVRHNKDVHIYNNYFDGINKDNRNGISFTDIDGAEVYNNIFENIARADMPGAVDFEPNPTPAESVCTNVTVRNNTFRNIGGGVGTINVYLPLTQVEMTTPANNISIYNNTLEDCYTGIRVSQDDAALTEDTIPVDLKIYSNHVKNITRDILFLSGINGYEVYSNTFEDSPSGIQLGYLTDFTANGRFRNNTLRRLASNASTGLSIWSIQNFDMIGNTFEDCGKGTAGSSNAVQFRPNETSTRVHVVGNTVTSPTGKTLVAIEGGGHNFDTANNVQQANSFNGLLNTFSARLKDVYKDEVILNTGASTKDGNLTLNNDLETKGVYKHSGLYNSANSAIVGATPKGGVLYDGAFNRQGAIKVTLPVFKTGGAFSFDINIYNNGNNLTLQKISVNGFLSSGGFDKASAVVVNGGDFDFNIRFGDDGSRSCIWVAETTTTFDQLLVAISEIRVNSGAGVTWLSGWNIGLVSAFGTVQHTKSANLPYSDGNKIRNLYDTVHSWTGKQTFQDAEFTAGATGNFTTADGKTVTVTKGIITNIV